MTWWQAVLAYVVGPIVVTAGTVLAAKVAARGSTTAAETATAVEKESVQIEGFHQLVTDLQADMVRLRNDHDALKADHESLKADHDALKGQAVKDQSLIRMLIGYVGTLRRFIVDLGHAVPEPPVSLRATDVLP